MNETNTKREKLMVFRVNGQLAKQPTGVFKLYAINNRILIDVLRIMSRADYQCNKEHK